MPKTAWPWKALVLDISKPSYRAGSAAARSTASFSHSTPASLPAVNYSFRINKAGMPNHKGGRSSLLSVTAWLSGIRPPPPTICDSPTGPFVTSLRIKLEDGRHLAYKEHGVPKEEAKYKIIFIHGSNSCRHDMPAPSPELVQELGIYLLSFDRAGYGESDPNPRRTEKTTALDVAELADQLNLGPRFYVIGHSMGGQAVWGCLKYIPHRLSGAVLLCPVVNYWWQSFPAKLVREAYNEQLLRDRWALGVAHYVPWLTYWWNTQRWFPSSSVAAGIPDVLSPDDKVLASIRFPARHQHQKHAKQQGEFETIHRDMMVGFGTWEFDPMELENPFPTGDGAVHLWHGNEDRLVPTSLQRHIARRLPWIRYHELPSRGHLFHIADGMFDNILRALLKETP